MHCVQILSGIKVFDYLLHSVDMQLQAEVKVHSESVNSLRTELEQAQQDKHEKVDM